MSALGSTVLATPSDFPKTQRLRRLLFLARSFPSPFEKAVHGSYQRLRLLLEASTAAADEVTIIFFVEHEMFGRFSPRDVESDLRKYWGIEANVRMVARVSKRVGWAHATFAPISSARKHPLLRRTSGPSQVEAVAAELAAAPTDLIIAYKLESAMPVLKLRDHPPLALDLDDIEFLRAPRMLARPPHRLGKLFEFTYWPALYFGERSAIRRSTVAFVCSDVARERLAKHVDANIVVAPNAVSFVGLGERRSNADVAGRPPTLLFVGLYAYQPNVEAAELLVKRIYPRIVARVPNARLLFVGGQIDNIRSLSGLHPGVVMRGFVDDLAEVYAEADVAVAPVFAGGGTRIKILDAVARHVPVVATSIGAEGLEFRDGHDILIRDDLDAFADACVALLRDAGLRERIADAASERARRYERSKVVEEIAGSLRLAT